ncbi:MAG: C_GCAxxG_C_C family protein [Bacteroidales bacterium]|nr:C_GCAxxG_C_C family protein [Bacteroidales bacterium]
MKKVDESLSLFKSGNSCAQSILMPFGKEYFKNPEDSARLAAGFEAGIAFKGEVCGAVSGAVMAIGLKYGHSNPSEELSKEQLYKLTKEYLTTFESKCGSTVCNKLLNVDISTQEGIDHAISNNLFDKVCTNAIKTSAEILDGIFENNKEI